MRWQRARVLATRPGNPPVGYEIWVQCGPPTDNGVSLEVTANGGVRAATLTYRTNILLSPDAAVHKTVMPEMQVQPRVVELLARGPEDFCEDPPRIAWGAWERDGRAADGS